MQSISLVPSTEYNDSLYTSDSKYCPSGSIVLEDRITRYHMEVTGTTAVSVDESFLHPIPGSTMEFDLTVFSVGTNVLNLSGFNVEQIQVANGTSTFHVQRATGCVYWTITMTDSIERPLRWLRCFEAPFNGTADGGMCTYANYKWYDAYAQGIMSNTPPFTSTAAMYGKQYANGSGGSVFAKFPSPVWLQSISLAYSTSSDINFTRFPQQMQVLATNDGITWTEVLSQSLTAERGKTDVYNPTITQYYTMFEFRFTYTNGQDLYTLPSIALAGYESDLINTGSYILATPYCTALPTNGWDIEANSSEMSSTSGTLPTITQFGSSYYEMIRSSTATPFEFIFTFPEAIRTIGILYSISSGAFKLFSLSYSDNKTDWTEYCKVDGSINTWQYQLSSQQRQAYFVESGGKHQYYKVTVYSNMNDSNTFRLQGLSFIKFVEGRYLDFETFVPKLSSNAQSGYFLVASNSSQGDAYKMFDHDASTYGGGDISNGEWTLLITLPQATLVKGMRLIAPADGYARMPYNFSLQGSADNDTWTNIKTFTLGSNFWSYNSQSEDFELDNSTAYKYYRIVATASAQGSTIRIGEIGLTSYPSFKAVDWYEQDYIVPVMRSNSQDGYIITAKSYDSGDYAQWRAFDRNGSDYWCTAATDKTDANKACDTWLQVQLPTAQISNTLNIVADPRADRYGRSPSTFTLDGSNDGETWTTLLTVTDQPIYTSFTWSFSNTTAYSYYRLHITKTNVASNFITVSQMNLLTRTYHN